MSNVTCNPFVYFWLNKVSIRNHECMRATNHVLNDYIPAFPRLREELLLLDEDTAAAARCPNSSQFEGRVFNFLKGGLISLTGASVSF